MKREELDNSDSGGSEEEEEDEEISTKLNKPTLRNEKKEKEEEDDKDDDDDDDDEVDASVRLLKFVENTKHKSLVFDVEMPNGINNNIKSNNSYHYNHPNRWPTAFKLLGGVVIFVIISAFFIAYAFRNEKHDAIPAVELGDNSNNNNNNNNNSPVDNLVDALTLEPTLEPTLVPTPRPVAKTTTASPTKKPSKKNRTAKPTVEVENR